MIGVQVASEIANVASRKMQLGYADVRQLIAHFRDALVILPVTEAIRIRGLDGGVDPINFFPIGPQNDNR